VLEEERYGLDGVSPRTGMPDLFSTFNIAKGWGGVYAWNNIGDRAMCFIRVRACLRACVRV